MFCVFYSIIFYLVLYGVVLGYVFVCVIKIGFLMNVGMNIKICKKIKLRENYLKYVIRLIN